MTLDEKYALLREKERTTAFLVARAVIRRPEVSLWMILLPVLFVFHAMNIQKYKNGLHAFIENFIRVKIKALDFALDAVQEKKSPKMDLETCFPSLDAEDEIVKAVCEKQMQEIRIACGHYTLLLNAEGEDFESLLKNAYGDSGRYRAFLDSIERAEEEVGRYVTRHFQTGEAALEVMDKMARTLHALREEDLKIFMGRRAGKA